MKKGTLLLFRFLAQLAGFFLGGLLGWVLGYFLAVLINGGPLIDQQGLIMMIVGPIGCLAGGVVGMILAGKSVKASSPHDSEPASGGPHRC